MLNKTRIKFTPVDVIIALRTGSILIQSGLVLFVNIFLGYELPLPPLFTIIFLEVVFNVICYIAAKKTTVENPNQIFIQLIADVVFLGFLLHFSGGATNAFVSLLLIPIAIAAVTLPVIFLTLVSMLAIATYSILLWMMPMHVMHGNMEGHFIGMWINFLFSATVVSIVISRMARSIALREKTIAKYREEQLKQEKIIALGVASTQVAHDIATPLASIQLLTEELLEDLPTSELLHSLDTQVKRCGDNLTAFRNMTYDIKENRKTAISCSDLIKKISSHCTLNYPHVSFEFDIQNSQLAPYSIWADSTLIPAVINIIDNAVNSSSIEENLLKKVEIKGAIEQEKFQLSIRDFGDGFSMNQFSELGNVAVNSKQGFGMAILLSHATLERLRGSLALKNHDLGGAEVIISLPVKPHDTSNKSIPE